MEEEFTIIKNKDLSKLKKTIDDKGQTMIKEFINFHIFIDWIEGFEYLLQLNKSKTLEYLEEYLTELIMYERNEFDTMIAVKNSILYLINKLK